MKTKATRAVIHNFPSMKKDSASDVLVDALPVEFEGEGEGEGEGVDDAT